MSGSRGRPSQAAKGAPESKAEDEFQVLREILFGAEIVGVDEVRELKHRVEDEDVRAEDIGAVLPRAIVIRAQKDGQLAAALRPTIEQTLDESVRKNPGALIDVIFPILGPSIRKMIGSSIATMVGSVNRAVESAFSIRGLRWRFEAWRTGRSYAEVALSHGVVYRVEKIFLIERDSGLLLSHVSQDPQDDDEPEVISSMLTAIRDFVRDSFDVAQASEVNSFQVGDLTLLVESGPRAVLAAVVRGIPPTELRVDLQKTVEAVHKEYATAIRDFEGDMDSMAGVEGLLEPNLKEEQKGKKERPFAGFVFWTLVFLGVLALGTMFVMGAVRANRAEAAIDEFVAVLRAEPGIVVTRAELEDDRWTVEGLRDPLAQDPAAMLESSPARSVGPHLRFEPYQSLEAPMVERRLADLLRPPGTVNLVFENGVLRIEGRATASWVDGARQRAAAAAGIDGTDVSGLVIDESLADLGKVQGELLSLAIRLDGSAGADAETATISAAIDAFRRVRDMAEGRVRMRLELVAVAPRADLAGKANDELVRLRDRMRAVGLTVAIEVIGPEALASAEKGVLVPRSATGEIRFRATIVSAEVAGS